MAKHAAKKSIFYRYVLSEHIGPFFFALSLIVFLFLMNYTLREAHRLFGRGLDTLIIAKMFYYHLAPTLALAIPMSVLVATVMAFVRIAADSEITILRSSGINLNRIIFPLFFASVGIAIAVYYFNNTILPKYNIESAKLSREIRRLKPTAAIYENTFTNIKNVKLFVKKLDDGFNEDREAKVRLLGEDKADIPVDHMYDVILYDQKTKNKAKTIIAKEGFVYLNPEKEVFEFKLHHGEIYESDLKDASKFQHSFFERTIFLMEANEYVMKEKKKNTSYKSNRQKNSEELFRDLEKEYKKQKNRKKSLVSNFSKKQIELRIQSQNEFTSKTLGMKKNSQKKHGMRAYNVTKDSISFKDIYKNYKMLIKNQLNATKSTLSMMKYSQDDINDIAGEWHKKYSIPFASIVFLLIGAPLGMMTKRGEAGRAGFVCLVVFIVYYVCLILGEELSEDGKIIPWLAIWSGNIFGGFLAVSGFFLLLKERSLADYINLDGIKSLFKKA